MAKSKNQRRLERLVAAGGKASMAALVALPIACGDANAPSEKTTARVATKGESREDVFARLDAAAAFNASTNLSVSAGACAAGDIPSSDTGLCASNQPSTDKKKILNISISASNTAPVKISTRASDGALLIDGKEAVVLEQSGWVVKTYRYKASTTTVVIKGASAPLTPVQDNVIVDLSTRSGPKAVDFSRLSSESTATSSDNLYVKGSAGADTAVALADGSVKVGSTLFFADSATPASLNLMLGAGDDVYDGSKFVGYKTAAGTHITYDLAPVYIFGQEGNDTFFSGAAIEWFVGGAGVDTVKSLGFTKNGDVYATSGGLDAAGASTAAAEPTGFVKDATLEAGWFPDTSTNPEKGYAALPFYDTLRADVLDLSGWLGAATKFHGASGEDAAAGSLFSATAGSGNDWAVNGDDFRPAQDIAGLVIDASKTAAANGDPSATNEVYLAAWPAGVHGSVTGTAVSYYGLAKLHSEVDDSNAATSEEYFAEFRAPRTSVTFTGDDRAEKFVQSAVPFADNLKGASADSAAKDTISYELRTRPVKVDFTYYGKGGDGDSATWNDNTFTTWNDGNHVVPNQEDSTLVLFARPVHGEGYYVGAPQNRVFVVTEADSLDGFHNVTGGAGSDWLIGSQGPNVLSGGPGNDMIEGYGGNDLISGGPGADLLDGGDKYSTAKAVAEYDVLDYSGAAAGVTVDLTVQQSDTLSGLNDTDLAASLRTTIDSKKKAGDGDFIWRFEGVKGSAFADTLTAKATGSILAGGAGNDTLTAATGAADLILGGDGDDYIEVVEADDAIDAGAGDDILDSADATLLNDWTVPPNASTTWDTNQPTDTASSLEAIASLPNNLWVYPRMSQYISATAYDASTISETYTEHTFTCGAGSDIVSWSRLSSRDNTATGAKDLISCNDEFPSQK